jgi:hypothetical protein
LKLYCVPEEVFLVVWVLREVQSSSGRVSLVESEEVLLPVTRICNEGSLEGFLVEVGDDGPGDLYPMPFDCDVRIVDPSHLADLDELEQIQ